MADFNYVQTLEDIGNGLVDFENGTFKLALCTAAYTADENADHTLSDIPGGAIVATVTLTGNTFADAVFDADDPTFTTPPSGSTVTQGVIYQDASPSGGSLLIRRISSATYSGFPFDTNDLDVLLAFPNDTYKIFAFVNA